MTKVADRYPDLSPLEKALYAKRAAEIITKRGWMQDGGYGENGERCLYTALRQATTETNPGSYCDTLMRLTYDLADKLGLEFGPMIIEWNDRPGRTVDEVLALLNDYAAENIHTDNHLVIENGEVVPA